MGWLYFLRLNRQTKNTFGYFSQLIRVVGRFRRFLSLVRAQGRIALRPPEPVVVLCVSYGIDRGTGCSWLNLSPMVFLEAERYFGRARPGDLI